MAGLRFTHDPRLLPAATPACLRPPPGAPGHLPSFLSAPGGAHESGGDADGSSTHESAGAGTAGAAAGEAAGEAAPETAVFEACSLSKAPFVLAVASLAMDGTLSLDECLGPMLGVEELGAAVAAEHGALVVRPHRCCPPHHPHAF